MLQQGPVCSAHAKFFRWLSRLINEWKNMHIVLVSFGDAGKWMRTATSIENVCGWESQVTAAFPNVFSSRDYRQGWRCAGRVVLICHDKDWEEGADCLKRNAQVSVLFIPDVSHSKQRWKVVAWIVGTKQYIKANSHRHPVISGQLHSTWVFRASDC